MGLTDLLAIDYSAKKTWIGQRDPRSKLFFGLSILTSIIFTSNLVLISVILLLSMIIGILTIGVKKYWAFIFGLKWYFLLFIIIYSLISGRFFTLVVAEVLLKLIGILTSFIIFNKTTTPDEVIDVLIKLKIPPKLAWTIGVSYRQAIFIIDDMTYIQQIQKKRRLSEQPTVIDSLKNKLLEGYVMLNSLLSRSIIRANEFSLALESRGWEKPHKTIIMNTSEFSRQDIYFFFISLIPILSLLFVSSQIYMS